MSERPGESTREPPTPLATALVSPGPRPGTVRNESGELWAIPTGWALLPPGDAGLTRRVKASGVTWTVQERVRRRTLSRGIWAPAAQIEAAREAIDQQRSDPAYARRRAADQRRREAKQVAYVASFEQAVLDFLNFDPSYQELAGQLAARVAAHATPVGSGTVARTQRISLPRRAEAATIAWMRHQTTAYDEMNLPRVKGLRRDVRRRLAERSRQVLKCYREGRPEASDCPLQAALSGAPTRVAVEAPPVMQTPKGSAGGWARD